MELLEILQTDYQKFPLDQTYNIYTSDVYFQDPMNSFRGVEKYQKMIGFINNWFQNPHLELHEIKYEERDHDSNYAPDSVDNSLNNPVDNSLDRSLVNSRSKIITRWTLSWNTPLPWQPRIAIPGWSELEINDQGLISSHIDYWNCSIWDVLMQHF